MVKYHSKVGRIMCVCVRISVCMASVLSEGQNINTFI